MRNKYEWLALFTSGLLIFAQSCGPKAKTDRSGPDELVPEFSLSADMESIQRDVADKYCVSCHNSTADNYGVDLTDLAVLVDTNNRFVVPSNAEASTFYKHMESGKMPPDSNVISEEILQVVKTWIDGLPARATEAITGLAPTTMSIQKNVADKFCVSCHGASGKNYGVDLTDLASLIQTNNHLIVAKNPLKSEFYTEILSGEMPRKADALPENIVEVVKMWIESLDPIVGGANGDDHHDEEEVATAPDTNIEANLTSVQAWVNRNCVTCHDEATRGDDPNGNRYVDLRDLTSIIRQAPGDRTTGLGRKLIEPGKPGELTFYTSMDPAFENDVEKLMPKGGGRVPKKVLDVISLWISQMDPLTVDDPCDPRSPDHDPNNPDCEDGDLEF